jgi:Ser/Thr protein kinase RdoA (MazF antagonist)
VPDHTIVKAITHTLYGFEAESLAPLDQRTVEGRGIYRVQDAASGTWVMRIKGLDELDGLSRTARLLEWLGTQPYPAPRVRPTITGQRVGVTAQWAVLMVSYIEGAMLAPEPAQLSGLAQMVARLHVLPSIVLPYGEHARCHPQTIAIALDQLNSYGRRIPPAFSSLVAELRASMESLLHHAGDGALCLTHGDCWYQNAIQGTEGSVTLIDWDNVGAGLPLLDLGGLLLTAHFDLRRPLLLQPSTTKIAAIVQGYKQLRPITAREQALLAEAMHFLLAVQLGSYLADGALVQHSEFPFVLQKLQARQEAARPIADIAKSMLVGV